VAGETNAPRMKRSTARIAPLLVAAACAAASSLAPVPAAAARILSASVTPQVIYSGTRVSFGAQTTPDVSSMIAIVSNVGTLRVRRIGTGRFAGSILIPWVAPYQRGRHSVTFIGRGAGGTARAVVYVFAR
jgi:hypothetical protein